MPTPITPYTPAKIAEIRSWTKNCPTWLEARETIISKLGIAPDNATKMHKRHGLWIAPQGATDSSISTSTRNDGFEVDVETSKAKTLDEVMTLCKVDTEKWESNGFSVRRGSKGYAWSARFKAKTQLVDEASMTRLFIKEAAKYAPSKWAIDKVSPKGAPDCLYVLNIQDLHLAKLAWGKETGGADWDIHISEQVYRQAVNDLIAKAPQDRIEEVLVIIGSDLIQVDNDQSATSKGTYVDSDSRLPKVFEVAAKMLTDVIAMLATRFKVRGLVVRGNHDSITSFFLGQYVAAWFNTHPNVTIDTSPKSRKYVPYGKTIIGFDHGDETPLKDLPLLLMRENQDTISQFSHQEVLTGHTHAEASQDTKGVVVRVAPALCSPDAWHARKGYVGSVRRSQGLLYQRENGLEAIFYSTALD